MRINRCLVSGLILVLACVMPQCQSVLLAQEAEVNSEASFENVSTQTPNEEGNSSSEFDVSEEENIPPDAQSAETEPQELEPVEIEGADSESINTQSSEIEESNSNSEENSSEYSLDIIPDEELNFEAGKAEEGVIDSAKEILSKYVKPKINKEKIEKEADNYFYMGLENPDKTTKDAYLSMALEKYMLLLKYDSKNPILATQVGAIHDNLGHSSIAKEYFNRAVNLENLNPFANFYYAEYYFVKKEYNNALKHYLVAYNNGYSNLYEVNLKLATVYEKLGDLDKAKYYYQISQHLNPELDEGISKKIQVLNKAYYSKSDFER